MEQLPLSTSLASLAMQSLKEKHPERYQRLLALLREKRRRELSQRACYYVPNEKAQVFIETVGGNECFIVFFIAANGVGKTAAGCNVLTNIRSEEHTS